MSHLRISARVPVVAAAGVALLVAGCSSTKSGGSDSGTDSGGKIAIGLVTKTNSNPYFVKLRESAQDEASKKGAKLIALAGKFDGDNQGQVDAINNLVAQNVKGILITPSNSTGVLGAIKAARDKGIVVIALDTATDPASAVDATFATDNEAAGVKQGKYVKGALKGKKPAVALLDGTPGSTVDDLRHKGFLKGFGLTNGSPEIKGTAVTNGDQTKAQTAMENLYQRDHGINAVYTINEPAAAGAAQALSGKSGVVIGSIDGSCTGVRNVQSGKFAATVMQFPKKMAQQGVDAVVAYAKDKTKPSGFTDTGSQLITDKPLPGLASKDTAWGLKNCWG
ncbi:substrate-binding domain-containing protein [Streptomyces spinosirectus]|uniref:substrate-binding domain-containing protein n=1 Tax=Streptomyces TaxID=1883 RepID=UPI000D3961F0|nr:MULTISPECIES: substrate-binding domain-containing protein [Streptomyces]MBY8346148.1 substrate-binding domain-containing protein [Streptomyces plumbidurans]PTM82399.1 fructose transport system substrate-binding protein [Streptomyces sp. VMFN-G11Ma]UIR22524.1 substrate-binding domain-containing protein [Streptomyces spinosirectus]